MIRRSRFIAAGLGAGTIASLAQGAYADALTLNSLPRTNVPRHRKGTSGNSIALAYTFLGNMMDLYATGSTLRLAQSYLPTAAQNLGDLAYTYDNAMLILALLQRGQTGDLSRAEVLGNSFVYAQANDPLNDGRVRDGYHVDPFLTASGAPRIADDDDEGGAHTGNVAWVGLALVHLYAKTNENAYLNAALAMGEWIASKTHDRRGAGGYVDGFEQPNKRIFSKATKANIVVFAFFELLSKFVGVDPWQVRAQHALSFVDAMFNAPGPYFWVGTQSDGRTVNTSFVPLEVQAWSYLATLNAQHDTSIDWAYSNLFVYAAPFIGVCFSTVDLTGDWFEGTAHMAAAFLARNASGDSTKATRFLSSIQLAQTEAPNNDGMGIDAATEDGLKTGSGSKYYAALHVGATSWYCIAGQSGNPFFV